MDFDHDKISPMMTPWCRSTFFVIIGNDLLDSSSTDAIIANGSETTVKFTGKLDRPSELSTGWVQ